jgi:predicted phosphodiesterase
MGCSAYRWTPEVVAKIAPALAEGGSIMAAARILGVAENALRSAIRTQGIDHRAICGSRAPVAPPVPTSPPRVNAPAEAPAWQGYHPRAGWTPPVASSTVLPAPAPVERVVCIADVHAPLHSRPAWATALALVKELNPTRVVLLGDTMEVEAVSKHPRARVDPNRLSAEFYETNVLLDDLQDRAPNASFLYLAGNHEDRIHKAACNDLGSVGDLLDVPAQLYMTSRGYHRETENLRGMEWVGLDRQPYQVSGVAYLHGVSETVGHAQWTAANLGQTISARTICYGHMHALQVATSAGGTTAWCCGWLGDAAAPTIRAYVKGRPRPWSHAIVYQEIDGDLVTTTPIPILTGRAVWAGARFAA